MNVEMKNRRTGEIKEVKIGWSWVLFFFSGFLGLPLFLRKLYPLASVFLALWVVNLIGPAMVPRDEGVILSFVLGSVGLGLAVFVGIKGNEMTAKNYLDAGWSFADPDSEATRLAKLEWGVQANHDNAANMSPSVATESDVLANLEKIASLRDRGILTQAEFEQKKRELLPI